MDVSPIVVGVDGSAPSRTATDLAIREARWHGRPLRLVHAFVWPTLGVYVGPSPEGPPDGGLAADADRLLAGELDHATTAAPDLLITGEVVTGAATPILLEEAGRAWLLVLGHRGLGGFAELLLGSVVGQVASHSPCPLLIARGDQRDTGPVVVGVDGSASDRAVEYGFAEAAARGAELRLLHSWHGRVPAPVEDELPLIYDAGDVEQAVMRRLSDAVAKVRERYPSVVVRQEVRRGRTARTLVEASGAAQLVVAGARGRGGFAGLLLGSVSQALLHHARCPVAIARTGVDHRPD